MHENNLTLDENGFNAAMDNQRQRARAARAANERVAVPDLSGIDVADLKVDPTTTEAKIVAIWQDGKLVEGLTDGMEAGIILSATPFYAEGGGQVGDAGTFTSEFSKIDIANAKKLPDGTVYHLAYVVEGGVKVGETVQIAVDRAKKLASARNHTATHLLQAALKKVVGQQVNQAGSLVTPERLRFDFSNFEPVSAQQLADVEELVNEEILRADDVTIEQMPIDEAKKRGAMALFGEKYGDIVRVVSVADFSMELCGGSHVKNVGQIGMFKIVAETGVAAGVRRIEAITGGAALALAQRQSEILRQTAAILKTKPETLPAQAEKLVTREKELSREMEKVAEMREKADAQKLLMGVEIIDGVSFVAGHAQAADMDELRSIADTVCAQLQSGVAILANVADNGKINLVVKATKAAVDAGVHAGKIVK